MSFINVQSVVGKPLYDILKIQSINSTQSLLDTNDIFEIFKYDSSDLIEIKSKSCFKVNDEYVVKVEIKNSSTYLTTLLKTKQRTLLNKTNNNGNNPRQISYELSNNNPLLRTLINSYEQNQNMNMNNNRNSEQLFLSSLIDNITDNLSRSKNNYQYSNSVKRVRSSVVYIGWKIDI